MLIVWTFVLVYIGMIFGGFRGLALDRTGIVLLGMIVLVAGGLSRPRPHGHLWTWARWRYYSG